MAKGHDGRDGAPGPGANGASRTASAAVGMDGLNVADEEPLYARFCPSCGFYEVSLSPALYWFHRECPRCSGDVAA
jgi:ribosomal protein S27AE